MRNEGFHAPTGSAANGSSNLALWRGIVRPLVVAADGDVLCDVQDPLLVERVLLHVPGRVHAALGWAGVEELRAAYAERLVVHESAADAWQDAPVTVAVIGAPALVDHRPFLPGARSLAAPFVIVAGPVDQATESLIDELATSGWERRESSAAAVVLVPATPGGAPSAGAMNGTVSGHAPPGAADPRSDLVTRLADQVSALEERLAAVEAERDAARRAEAEAEDMLAALRLFLDEARDALAAERRNAAAMEDQRAHHHRRAQRFKSEADVLRGRLDEVEARLLGAQAVMQAASADLERVAASQSWKVGHAIARVARVLTLRKPGSSDGLTAVLERLRKAASPGRSG